MFNFCDLLDAKEEGPFCLAEGVVTSAEEPAERGLPLPFVLIGPNSDAAVVLVVVEVVVVSVCANCLLMLMLMLVLVLLLPVCFCVDKCSSIDVLLIIVVNSSTSWSDEFVDNEWEEEDNRDKMGPTWMVPFLNMAILCLFSYC